MPQARHQKEKRKTFTFFFSFQLGIKKKFKTHHTLTSHAVNFLNLMFAFPLLGEFGDILLLTKAELESELCLLHSVSLLGTLTFFLGFTLGNPCFSFHREPTKATDYLSAFSQVSKFSFKIIFTCSSLCPLLAT